MRETSDKRETDIQRDKKEREMETRNREEDKRVI